MRLIIAVLVTGSIALCAFTAKAIGVNLDGTSLEIPNYEGLCFLRKSETIEREMIEQQERLLGSGNRLLAIAFPCADLAEMRQGKSPYSAHWIIWLAPLNKGQLTKLPTSYTRERALQEMSVTMPKLNIGEINASIAERAKKEGVSTSMLNFGVIDQSSTALYAGMLSDVTIDQVQRRVAGVVGMTVANSYLITVSHYSPYISRATYDTLLERAKSSVQRLLASQPIIQQPLPKPDLPPGMKPLDTEPRVTPHIPASTSSRFNWGHIIEKGISGALIGGVIALFIGLISWIKSRFTKKPPK